MPFIPRLESLGFSGISHKLLANLFSLPLLFYAIIQIFYVLKLSPNEKVQFFLSLLYLFAFILKFIHLVGIFLIFIFNERKMATLKAENETLNDLKIIFGGLAHEIKTPIQTLSTIRTDIINRQKNKDVFKISTLFDKFNHQIAKIVDIVDRIKITSERGIKLSRCNINTLIHKAVESINNTYPDRKFKIIQQTHKGVLVNVDKFRIERAFINIMRNCVDSFLHHKGDEVGKIDIKAYRKRSNNSKEKTKIFGVEFTDNGCGVSEENLKKIFNSDFTTKKGLNRGLGLFLVKYFVESCKGEIEIFSSGKNCGTSVLVSLPMATDDNLNS